MLRNVRCGHLLLRNKEAWPGLGSAGHKLRSHGKPLRVVSQLNELWWRSLTHWLHGLASMAWHHGVRVPHAIHTLDINSRVHAMPNAHGLHVRLREPPRTWCRVLPLRRERWTAKHPLRSCGPWLPARQKRQIKSNIFVISLIVAVVESVEKQCYIDVLSVLAILHFIKYDLGIQYQDFAQCYCFHC